MVKNVTFEHGNIVNQLIVNKQHQEADTFVLELVIYFFSELSCGITSPTPPSLFPGTCKRCAAYLQRFPFQM